MFKIKKLVPVLSLFVIANLFLILGYENNWGEGIKHKFIITVNLMLVGMSIFNFIRINKLASSNPHAMVRSVMVGTILKMLVFAGSALAYASLKLGPVGIPTLLICMGLYLLYTWLEIQWTIKQK
jgi:hypothetical protein